MIEFLEKFVIEKEKVDEEELLDLVLEAGAEDVKEEETEFNVITANSQE